MRKEKGEGRAQPAAPSEEIKATSLQKEIPRECSPDRKEHILRKKGA